MSERVSTPAQPSNFREVHIERAVAYVSDYWFPVNSGLLNKIHQGLKGGSYENDLDTLVGDIKSDFSLFTFCIRELLAQLKKEGLEKEAPGDPLKLCEWGGLERLKSILEVDEKQISKHSIAGISKEQMSRFHEALLSASTAETLASKFSVDPGTGFSVALLRQLGHTLIAWNYSQLYQKALLRAKEGENIDIVLAKLLGFSPTLLAMRIVRSWGVAPEICAAMHDTDRSAIDEETAIFNTIGSTLSRLCRVGEALARANNPEIYPTAKEDWELARIEIEARLGKDGLEIIREKYQDNCEQYLTFMPEIFSTGLSVELSLNPNDKSRRRDPSSVNPYVQMCHTHIRMEFQELYTRIETHTERENIRYLIQEILPLAGFNAGVVYTADPGLLMLVPQLKTGNLKLNDYTAIDYSLVTSNSNITSVAFQSNEPVVEYRAAADSSIYAAIAGFIGASERIGVVYLEMPYATFCVNQADNMIHFKAISHALNDCLKLT